MGPRGRHQSGWRSRTAWAGTAALRQPPGQGIRARRWRCRPLSAPGSGQVGPRSSETPSRSAWPDTPWGPSSNSATSPRPPGLTEASQLMAGTSQRACSRGLRAMAGRSITPPEVSAAQRQAGWARGTSRRSNSWRCCQRTCSTSSSQGQPASNRPSSRTGLLPQRPRQTKLAHSGPRSRHCGAPLQLQGRGWSR